jgi:hypothetical protein
MSLSVREIVKVLEVSEPYVTDAVVHLVRALNQKDAKAAREAVEAALRLQFVARNEAKSE